MYRGPSLPDYGILLGVLAVVYLGPAIIGGVLGYVADGVANTWPIFTIGLVICGGVVSAAFHYLK